MAEQPPPSQPPAQPPPGQTPPPQWAPPQQQPAWGQPPPGAWGQPGYTERPSRPIGVTIGGIWLILAGLLWLLAGAGCMFGGTFVSGLTEASGIPSDLADAVGGVFFGAGLIGLILAVLQIASGAGAFGGRGWARWIGIILSILFAIPLTLSVLTSIGSTSQDGVIQFLVFSIIFLV